MKIKFYLKRPNAKSETTIFALVNYNGNSLKVYTGESIIPKHWNKKSNSVRSSLNEHPEFNIRLDKIRSDIKRVFMEYQNKHDNEAPPVAVLKSLIEVALKKGVEKITFLGYFEDFVLRSMNGQRFDPSSKKAIRHGVGKGYLTTLNHLKKFDKEWKRKLDFETIDLDFHADFSEYLSTTGTKYDAKVKKMVPLALSANTIGTNIKRIKAVLSEATERGVNNNMAFRSKFFIKQSEDAETIYLNETELEKLKNLNLSTNPRLENVRDLFLIGCYTGLRFSDLSALKPGNIKDGFIRLTQIKTDKPVTIPVHKVVRDILKKYNGDTPRQISNVKMNEYLKELGQCRGILNENVTRSFTKGGKKVTETVPKWSLLVTHTARRTFATMEYKRGFLTLLEIMSITGHSTQAAFLKYIRVTPEEHAQSAKKKWEQYETAA